MSRKTVVVLGAGASRGASFVQDQTTVLPPLDLDFFQQLARMPNCDESRRLLAFVRREYGHEIGLSMEQFFSQADYTDRFHKELNVDPGPFVKKYSKALDDFMQILPKMLNQTTSRPCEYHRTLASLLDTKDCVISFNYDCLMDRALKRSARQRWDPDKNGYGFPLGGGGEYWKKHTVGRPVISSIRLLKMHGSLNWRRTANGQVELVQKTKDVTSLADSIIPPTWFKNLQVFPFGDVWKAARREVRTCRVMIVIGYSVPQTDLFSRSLFRVEAGSKEKREHLELLVLVNPEPGPRKQFLDIIREGLEANTKVLEYSTFEDLTKVFKRNGTPVPPSTQHDEQKTNEDAKLKQLLS